MLVAKVTTGLHGQEYPQKSFMKQSRCWTLVAKETSGLRPLLQLFCNIFKNIFVFLKVKMLHGGKSDHRLAPTSGCCRWRLPVSGRYVPSKTYYKPFPSKPDGMLRINFYFQNCSCFQPICSVKDLRHTMQNHSRLNLTTYDVTKLK